MAKRPMGTHFEQLLGLEAPWRVQEVDLALDEGEVRIHVERSGRARLRCPHCGGVCPGYDTRERRWRHLDTMQYRTIVIGRVPRVECSEHGVVQVAVPWADESSRFTALFEALAIDWLQEASFAAVARQLGLSWDQVARIQDRAVRRGLARRDREPPKRIGVDETSFQKRHEYVTTVNDLDESVVLFVGDDRKQATLDPGFRRGARLAPSSTRSLADRQASCALRREVACLRGRFPPHYTSSCCCSSAPRPKRSRRARMLRRRRRRSSAFSKRSNSSGRSIALSGRRKRSTRARSGRSSCSRLRVRVARDPQEFIGPRSPASLSYPPFPACAIRIHSCGAMISSAGKYLR